MSDKGRIMVQTRRRKANLFLILLFLLVDSRFLYLVPFPGNLGGALSNVFSLALAAVLISVIYILCIIRGRFRLGEYGRWIVALYIIVIIGGIYEKIVYDYKITSIIWECIPFLILLLYFPFRDWMSDEWTKNKFIVIGEIVSDLATILFLIQSFYYTGANSVFLKLEGAITDRYLYNPELRLRIYGAFDGFMRMFILIVGEKIIVKDFKKCKFDIFSFFLMFAGIVFVDQSRYYIITVLFSFFAMFITKNRRFISPRSLFFILFGFIAGTIFLSQIFGSIMDSIWANEGSSYARVGAVEYYLTKLPEHFLCGLGRVIPTKEETFYTYIKGPLGIYNYDDIGIFGVFASMGFLGFVWYISILIKFIGRFTKRLNDSVLAAGTITAFIIAIPVMSYLDKGRQVAMMLTFAIMESEYRKKRTIEK